MKPFFEKKCWGEVCHVFESKEAAVSYLKVNEGFCCSKHRHRFRANQFTVISGQIVVEIWNRGVDNLLSRVVLESGQTMVVESGIYHRFLVTQTGEVVEVYWSDNGGIVGIHDIERLDEGGPI